MPIYESYCLPASKRIDRVAIVAILQAEMRERLAKDKDATYTYSVDYVSQTVSMVDEFRVKEDQEVNEGPPQAHLRPTSAWSKTHRKSCQTLVVVVFCACAFYPTASSRLLSDEHS